MCLKYWWIWVSRLNCYVFCFPRWLDHGEDDGKIVRELNGADTSTFSASKHEAREDNLTSLQLCQNQSGYCIN